MTDATPARPSRPGGARPRTPRWVKVSLALVLLAILAVVAMKVFGGAGMQHGPGRHGQGPLGEAGSGYVAGSAPAQPAVS